MIHRQRYMETLGPKGHRPDSRAVKKIRVANGNVDAALVKREDQAGVITFNAMKFDVRHFLPITIDKFLERARENRWRNTKA